MVTVFNGSARVPMNSSLKMAAKMSTEETFRFITLYRGEGCLWNPKNKNHKNKKVINDAWKRISDEMDFPIHELKKKKDNLLATFRINLRRKNSFGEEDVYSPIWIFYDAMEEFLKDVYEESTGLLNVDEKADSVWIEEPSSSPLRTGDYLSEEHCYDMPFTTLQNKDMIKTEKRCASNSPELHQDSKRMFNSFTPLNNTLDNTDNQKEEDECDLFCKMLAKQLKEYPKLDRQEIMYELHGVMLNKRRRYERINSND